jgi:hypothetical protein
MASETIDFKCYTCASDGSGAAVLTAATQRTASASANDNKQIVINVKGDHIPSGSRYIKFGLVTGGATGGPACLVALGLAPKYAPASDYNLTSVVEVKS